MGGREGLIDTAVKTAETGKLTSNKLFKGDRTRSIANKYFFDQLSTKFHYKVNMIRCPNNSSCEQISFQMFLEWG